MSGIPKDRFVRQYVAYRTSVGQDQRDPSTYPVTVYGAFESEDQYQETVSREEDIRDAWQRRAREKVNA